MPKPANGYAAACIDNGLTQQLIVRWFWIRPASLQLVLSNLRPLPGLGRHFSHRLRRSFADAFRKVAGGGRRNIKYLSRLVGRGSGRGNVHRLHIFAVQDSLGRPNGRRGRQRRPNSTPDHTARHRHIFFSGDSGLAV